MKQRTKAFQRSLADLGTPLEDTTFCVLDVETTGGSPATGAITEIGAVRVRAGHCEATWSTLVDPGMAIPGFITGITGIDAATVADAPAFHEVADALSSFVGDAVIVGHNVRYDLGFLDAELERAGHKRLSNQSVCTLALARRLVRDEVPNCKLGTLATYLRLGHQPNHRALDDALATVDLFAAMLDRAARHGVLGLNDLLDFPRMAGHPQASKLRLTDALPHAPGVYLFQDRSGNVLYVGKATDLRTRVRSYFSSDDRRKVPGLLRATQMIHHEVCDHSLAAAVREVDLIAAHLPRFNSHATRWRSMAYVTFTDEQFPRLTVVRTPPTSSRTYLGPLPSAGAAHRVIDAVTSVVPLRRCSGKIPQRIHGQLALAGIGARPPARCTPAQLGVSTCPCSGDISPNGYAQLCEKVRAGFTTEPALLLGPLRDRLVVLASAQRFEQAAEVRERAATLADAIWRRRRLEAWRTPRRVLVELADGSGAAIIHGQLGQTWSSSGSYSPRRNDMVVPTGPIPREELYARLCIVTEMERTRSPWRIIDVDGELSTPCSTIDRFEVRRLPEARSDR